MGIRACLAGHRIAFRTATGSRCWPTPNATATWTPSWKLQRLPLLIVDEVGYIPFDPQAANLMFMLGSRRYERASLIARPSRDD